MISRDKLIAAAAHVYAEAGYRGATTRRIADEAGVNEITIFRLFGSKAALIEAALRSRTGAHSDDMPALPDVPVAPERELTAWCSAHLEYLRGERAMIRKSFGEVEERPDMAPCGAECSIDAAHALRDYMKKLRLNGFTDYGGDTAGTRVDPYAAGAMLMSALLSDAMGREVMPEMFPRPAERAAGMYVRCFLRAIGCGRVEARRPKRGAEKPRNARPARPTRSARRATKRVAARSKKSAGVRPSPSVPTPP